MVADVSSLVVVSIIGGREVVSTYVALQYSTMSKKEDKSERKQKGKQRGQLFSCRNSL